MARSQLAVCGFVYSRLHVFPIIQDMIDWIVNSIQHRGLHLESYNHNLICEADVRPFCCSVSLRIEEGKNTCRYITISDIKRNVILIWKLNLSLSSNTLLYPEIFLFNLV